MLVMPLLTILIVLIVVGFVLWLANTYIPMEPTIKKILNIVTIILLLVWLLNILGVWHYLSQAHL